MYNANAGKNIKCQSIRLSSDLLATTPRECTIVQVDEDAILEHDPACCQQQPADTPTLKHNMHDAHGKKGKGERNGYRDVGSKSPDVNQP